MFSQLSGQTNYSFVILTNTFIKKKLSLLKMLQKYKYFHI